MGLLGVTAVMKVSCIHFLFNNYLFDKFALRTKKVIYRNIYLLFTPINSKCKTQIIVQLQSTNTNALLLVQEYFQLQFLCLKISFLIQIFTLKIYKLPKAQQILNQKTFKIKFTKTFTSTNNFKNKRLYTPLLIVVNQQQYSNSLSYICLQHWLLSFWLCMPKPTNKQIFRKKKLGPLI